MNLSEAFAIPAAYCAGHFPSQPIVPGVVELEFMRRALVREGLALCEIRQARFKQLLRPEEPLRLEAKETEPGRFRAALKRDDVPIVEADMAFATLSASAASREALTGEPLNIPPLDRLMPHRPPMRFVEQVWACDAESAVARCRIPAACALASEGFAPALAAIEAAAQTAALWQALRPREGASEGPRMGYLVSVRGVRFEMEALEADAPFTASIRADSIALPLSTYVFEVESAGRLVASGRFGGYLAD